MSVKTWYIVPVRGASKGVPRKNARLLMGKPLMSYVLETLKSIDAPEQIIVITDDHELEAIAEKEGVQVVKEPQTTGNATLDDVCFNVLPDLKARGAQESDILLTIQATCPYIKGETIVKARETLMQSGGSVVTVMDDRHLSWTVDDKGVSQPLYKERVNRQKQPPNYRESGAVIGSVINLFQKTKTRINAPVNIVEIDKKEGLDIDSHADWALAEYYQTIRKILVRADASKKIGMGHVYRALTLLNEISKHEIVIATKYRDGDTLGYDFLSQYPYAVHGFTSDEEFLDFAAQNHFDYVFLDQLSTTSEYVKALKTQGSKVITFEDIGEGAKEADLVINDLYKIPGLNEDKQLYGIRYSLLPPLFQTLGSKLDINAEVEDILILFGGSDPLDLTSRSLKALQNIGYSGNVTVVQGMGSASQKICLEDYNLKGRVLENITNMAKVMKECDIAFSSAGRTITELLKMGVPTLCICQNERELTHSHASQMFGVHNIGLGSLVSDETIEENAKFLINNYEFRKKMQVRAKDAMKDHSNKNIMNAIQVAFQDDKI